MLSCVIVGKVGVECVCMYCRKVFRNPVSFKHCKHVFCAECANRMMLETRRCHLCAARVESEDITECKLAIIYSKIITRLCGRAQEGQRPESSM